MTGEVIIHDFGKERNEASSLIFNLLGIIGEQEEELRNDPVRLFTLACDEITRLKIVIEKVYTALTPPPDVLSPSQECLWQPMRTISIPEWKYETYKELETIIRKAYWNRK
jgi:hypothetical protein